MKYDLLPSNGQFYKANLHTHTVVSDGRMTPEEIKKAYLEKGYSIVAFTDHEIIVPHNTLSDESFLAITACELSVTEAKPDIPPAYRKTYHLNLLSKDPQNTVFSAFSDGHVRRENTRAYITEEMRKHNYHHVYSVECINDIISRSNAEGFLVTYNHPVWSQQNYNDYADLKGLWGVEVFNSTCVRIGYPDTQQPLDDLLRKGEKLFPLATDDAHNTPDFFGGWVMVKAERLEYKAVMDALERGEFYASAGPEIHDLFLEDGILHLRTSDAAKIRFSTERRVTGVARATEGKALREASFDLNAYWEATHDFENAYFRVTVEDAKGNCAWTRAYFLNEFN